MSETKNPNDEALMNKAIAVAEQAMHHGEAPIGVVIHDRGGNFVSRGWNQSRLTSDITRHAEMVALADACKVGEPQEQDLVLASTLEPCVMCWGACLETRVSKIIYGLEAPDNGGENRICRPHHQIKAIPAVQRSKCRSLFEEWLRTNKNHDDASFVSTLLNKTPAI